MITLVIVILGIRNKKVYWAWDILLFGAQGIGGCVIAFLFFFSVHPTVGSNWMLMMLNPLPLFYLPVMVYKAIKGRKDYFHLVNAVVLTLFIVLMPFIQQKFNPTVLPLALNLLLISLGHIYLYYWKHR